MTTREIVDAARQRNASAISYHFGSRQGLLLALLARRGQELRAALTATPADIALAGRGGPVDDERGRRRDELGDEPMVADLVACLVEPFGELLGSASGRSYLRIVAQLRGRFASWRVESDAATTHHLARVLDAIEQRASPDPDIARERVVALIMLMTSSIAERARRIDDGSTPNLSHDAFVANLVAMCTAVVVAGNGG